MEGEREGENRQCVVASHVPPTKDLAYNPGMCPDWELNQQLFGTRAGTQSPEPHQPGQESVLLIWGSRICVSGGPMSNGRGSKSPTKLEAAMATWSL